MRLKNYRFISLRFGVLLFILIISLFIECFIIHCSYESRGDLHRPDCATVQPMVSHRDNDRANMIWPYKSGSVKNRRGAKHHTNNSDRKRQQLLCTQWPPSVRIKLKKKRKETQVILFLKLHLTEIKFHHQSPTGSQHFGAIYNLFILSNNWIFLQRKPHSWEECGRQEGVKGCMRATETQDSSYSGKYSSSLYLNPIQLWEGDLIYRAVFFCFFFSVVVDQPKPQVSRVLTSRRS